MNRLPLTLFTRLYISIVIAIILSIATTKVIIDKYDQEESIRSFIHEIDYIHQSIKQIPPIDINKVKKKITLPPPYNVYFSAYIYHQDGYAGPCSSCQHIASFNNINYFELANEDWLAEIPLDDINKIITISETNEGHIEEQLHMDIDELAYLLLMTTSILLIGLMIYWPIRTLQIEIRSLVSSHKHFGNGHMHTRADENIQKPLDSLAHSFNNMAEELDQSMRESGIFSQAIPHEVKTPLSRIQLASGLIKRNSKEENTIALADNIDTYATDINELIDQIVEFHKLKHHDNAELASHTASIPLKTFINSRIALLKYEKQTEMIIEIDSELEIDVNSFYLRLVTDNLLKNAFNYANKTIRIVGKSTDHHIYLSVENDGPRIPKSDHEIIFMPFARLDKSRSRQTGGLGLGLAIAKAAAQKMRGTIYASDSPLGGAEFEVIFLEQST